MNSIIGTENVVSRTSKIIFTEIDEDLVILSIDNSKYYGTRVVGQRIWQLLKQPIGVSNLCSQLQQEFEVDEETCLRDVLSFLNQLNQENLIEVIS